MSHKTIFTSPSILKNNFTSSIYIWYCNLNDFQNYQQFNLPIVTNTRNCLSHISTDVYCQKHKSYNTLRNIPRYKSSTVVLIYKKGTSDNVTKSIKRT